jgi:hypothetical protein
MLQAPHCQMGRHGRSKEHQPAGCLARRGLMQKLILLLLLLLLILLLLLLPAAARQLLHPQLWCRGCRLQRSQRLHPLLWRHGQQAALLLLLLRHALSVRRSAQGAPHQQRPARR